MATLLSLPNELLLLICNAVYPRDLLTETHAKSVGEFNWISASHSRALRALAALARTSRRFPPVAEPMLYARGVECHNHLPLAWAAKFGVEATLTKALAAGASPAHVFGRPVPAAVAQIADDVHRASRDWANNDPAYWPPIDDRRRAAVLAEDERQRGGVHWKTYYSTPDRLDLDLAALHPARPSRSRREPASSSGSGSDTGAVSVRSRPRPRPRLEHTRPGGGVGRQYTALHLAAKGGHTSIVRILLDHGADIDAQSLCFCSLPVERGHVGPAWSLTDSCSTSLHVAICASHPDTARFLVSRMAQAGPVDASRGSTYYGLRHAAATGSAELVQHMLETYRNLPVDLPDRAGLTPLSHACANRHWRSTVPVLLARGANIDAPLVLTRRGEVVTMTPLSNACRRGHFEDALELIELGADISLDITLVSQYLADYSPDRLPVRARIPLLHVCCMGLTSHFHIPGEFQRALRQSMQESSRPALIRRLLAMGTSPDAKWRSASGNGCGETALTVAVRHLNLPAVKVLLEAGALVHDDDNTWRGRSTLMLVSVTAECQACVWNPRDFPWFSSRLFLPCHHALSEPFLYKHRNRPTIARLLIDAGAQVNHQDQQGNTALHLLFVRPPETEAPRTSMGSDVSNELLDLLLSRGADPCLLNAEGTSVVKLAVASRDPHALHIMSNHFHTDLVKRLPVDEITAIFHALPWSSVDGCGASEVGGTQPDNSPTSAGNEDVGDLGTESPLNSGSTDDGREESPCDDDEDSNLPRLLGALMGMDSSGGLASFFCGELLRTQRAGPAAELANVLYKAGLEKPRFDQDARQALLRIAVLGRHWHMANKLLDVLPEVCDINGRDESGHTLLSLVTGSNFHCRNNPDVDARLVEAGADVHMAVHPTAAAAPGLSSTGPADTNFMTPLRLALARPAAFNIEWMLERQPIRGNPRAAAALYLHWAVTQLDDQGDIGFWPARDGSIRALLAAGADTAQLDHRGDTALSALLGKLVGDVKLLQHTYHWFKPLSRGVDINRRNEEGKSVVDYLDVLLGQPWTAKYVGMYVRLVTLENGERGIQWLN